MYVAPKIIVFTKNKEKFMQYNREFQNNNNLFYAFGGIATTFDEIQKFLKIEIKSNLKKEIKSEIKEKHEKSGDIQLTFEYINSIEKLEFPLFFKSLIDKDLNFTPSYKVLINGKYFSILFNPKSLLISL